jgi:DNA-binding NarL/FixJ family response regulator
MSGRTEMSTTLQDPNLEPTSSTGTTIALIGPNAAHRRVMVKALSGAEARTVREFIDYPASLADIPNLMEEHFDVVMIDVDSDQSYALQIVESIAALNTAIVMVYSMRNDPDLLRDCMRAGARDFLPLPEDVDVDVKDVEVDVSDTPAEATALDNPPSAELSG